jgi:7-carboxy-7-deazaguanine synthase
LAQVASYPGARHVVLTGGEPMIARNITALTRAIADRGYHTTIETAGTVYADVSVDLFSISPKLSNSAPGPEHLVWRERHERARINIGVIQKMIRVAADYQLKFVVSSPGDLEEIESIIALVNPARPSQVLLMPEGCDVNRLDELSAWLVEECKSRGYRYCDRLHIRIFGNRRGT